MSYPAMFSLDNRVAIVTGAAGLLGEHHCRVLTEAGASVAVCDIDHNRAKSIAEQLGKNHLAFALDVSKPESIEAVRSALIQQFKRIDIVVNNAAVNDMVETPLSSIETSKFENYPLDLWRRVIDVNLTGVFLCCQIFGSEMVKRGAGSIINLGSTYGVVAPDQNIYRDEGGHQMFYKSAAYPVSKAGVVMLSKFLASYWGTNGIRVNTISPGGVENGQPRTFIQNYSERTALGYMASASDFKGALIFLASDASRYVTGHNLIVDGGWTIL